jgi:predicted carbohydrate-binding protein with CBM5 and CBM33 domain
MTLLARLGAATAAVAIAVLAAPSQGFGHGAMQYPISRSYLCYLDEPEAPRTDICKAVVAAGGAQPLYDWMEVNIGDAAGRHRQLIPDGHLCSAGRDKYRGLDLARADWPTTPLTPGATVTFQFIANAPHLGTFELYLTKPGFRPDIPLTWDALETTPFMRVTNPPISGGNYQLRGTLPRAQGRQLIYTIWQRSDSPEAFYACSDVTFGGAPATAPPPKNSAAPSHPASPSPARRASQTQPPSPTAPASPTTPAASLPTTGTDVARFAALGVAAIMVGVGFWAAGRTRRNPAR